MCKRESSANIKLASDVYAMERSGRPFTMAQIDARGLDFVEFFADGVFKCVGEGSGTKFPEVELQDGEWFDYDEKEGQEVSITDIAWTFAKS